MLTGWFCVFDLEHVGWWRADGVVGIRHESRVCTALHFDAGQRECGLGESVILGHECEFDHVARRCHDGVWAEDKAGIASYCDLWHRGEYEEIPHKDQSLRLTLCIIP